MASSINRKRSAMRKFIKFLNNRDYIAENFIGKIETVKQKKSTKKDVLENYEIQNLNLLLKSDIDTATDSISIYRAYRNRFILLTLILFFIYFLLVL